jgi:hypothetical protein
MQTAELVTLEAVCLDAKRRKMRLAFSHSFRFSVLAAPVPERRRTRQLPEPEGVAANHRTWNLPRLTSQKNLSCNSSSACAPVVQATRPPLPGAFVLGVCHAASQERLACQTVSCGALRVGPPPFCHQGGPTWAGLHNPLQDCLRCSISLAFPLGRNILAPV